MKKISFVIADNWRGILISIASVALVAALFVARLGTLPGGLNAEEYANWQTISSNALQPLDVLRDSMWLPHTIWLFIAQYLPTSHSLGPILLRAFSVFVALAAVAAFVIILHKWFNLRIALLGGALFASSSWLLHVGRYGTHDVLYLLPLIPLAAWTQLQTGRHRTISLAVAVISAALCMYVPGMVWLIVPALLLQRKFLHKQLRSVSPGVSITLLIATVLLVIPFGMSIAWPPSAKTPLDVLAAFIGLPQQLPTVQAALHSIGEVCVSLVWRGSNDPRMFTGQAPLIGLFGFVMFVLGLYDFVRNNLRLDRTKVLGVYLLLGLVLIGLHGTVGYVVLLPAIYLIIANGVRYMLHEWLSVFPRNPVARGLGIGLMTFVVALTVSYHIVSYYVAWPHAPATKSSFRYQI